MAVDRELAKTKLRIGNKYPYDGMYRGEPEDVQDWAHEAARGIMCDLTDRKGIRQALDFEDDGIREDIVDNISEIIRLAYERDRKYP